MPGCVHVVSYRNGSQVMVRGLSLGEALGYCRNARVQVTDATGNAANVPWVFVVPNDEHATLVCNNPAPPQWIQPGVCIRIDVQPPVESMTDSTPSDVAVRLPETPTPAPVERAAESPKSQLGGRADETPRTMTSILSLDFPWGAQNVVGAALARIQSSGVHIIAHALPMPTDPPRGPRDAEIDAFIRTGAALGTALPGDSTGPFLPGMPSTPQSRELYVDRLAASLVAIAAAMPATMGADVLLIDVPLVPASVAQANPPQPQKQASMRPLDRAFQSKVRVPVANATPNQTNLARFQAGVMRGYRPGYALAHVARHVFGSETVLESFPQLVVGALAEMAVALNLPPPLGLTHHKRRPFAGQAPLMHLITTYLGGKPRWASAGLTQSMMADGFDALLGLLPVLPLYGIRPPGGRNARYATPIKLLNLAQNPVQGAPQRPQRGAGPLPAHALNCRHWIAANPQIKSGIDDSGLFALDLDVWQ